MKEGSKKSSSYSKPLLYIHQPGTKSVEVNMQQVYRSIQEREVESTEIPDKYEIIVEEVETEQLREIMDVEAELSLEEEQEQHVQKKPFKQMNVGEKIEYLLNRPSYIPNPLCEITFCDDNIIGYISKQQGEVLFIRTQASVEEVIVPVKDITSVRMLIW